MMNNLTKIYDFFFPKSDPQIYQVAFAFVRVLYTLILFAWIVLGVPLILFLYSDRMKPIFSLDSCMISYSALLILFLFSVTVHFFALRSALSRFPLAKRKNIFGEKMLIEQHEFVVSNTFFSPKIRTPRVDEVFDFMMIFNKFRISWIGPPAAGLSLVFLPFFFFFTRNMDGASRLGYFYFMMYICWFFGWMFAWSIGTVLAAKEAFIWEDMMSSDAPENENLKQEQ